MLVCVESVTFIFLHAVDMPHQSYSVLLPLLEAWHGKTTSGAASCYFTDPEKQLSRPGLDGVVENSPVITKVIKECVRVCVCVCVEGGCVCIVSILRNSGW